MSIQANQHIYRKMGTLTKNKTVINELSQSYAKIMTFKVSEHKVHNTHASLLDVCGKMD